MQEFDIQNIFTDEVVAGDKTAVLNQMALLLAKQNGLDEVELATGFQAREAESTTGFGNGVAIPHAKIAELNQPVVGLVTFKEAVDWESLDEQPVNIAIALIMPLDDPNKTHLKVLSKFARKLMDDEFIGGLQTNRHDTQGLYALINNTIDFN